MTYTGKHSLSYIYIYIYIYRYIHQALQLNGGLAWGRREDSVLTGSTKTHLLVPPEVGTENRGTHLVVPLRFFRGFPRVCTMPTLFCFASPSCVAGGRVPLGCSLLRLVLLYIYPYLSFYLYVYLPTYLPNCILIFRFGEWTLQATATETESDRDRQRRGGRYSNR